MCEGVVYVCSSYVVVGVLVLMDLGVFFVSVVGDYEDMGKLVIGGVFVGLVV